MIRHHPSDATLLTCAAGTLPVLHASVVAVHAAQCPACRDLLRLGAQVGGALLQDLPPEPLSDDALSRTLARLDEYSPLPLREGESQHDLLAELATGRWRWIAPGIRLMPLVRRDASDTRFDLIRVAPGIALPEHSHNGMETTCVLRGAFADESGEYHAGDFAEPELQPDHQPIALAGEECICLIATTGRLRAHGLITRLLQRAIGV